MSVLELELIDVKSRSVFLRWKNYAPDSRRLLSWVVSYQKTSVLCFYTFLMCLKFYFHQLVGLLLTRLLVKNGLMFMNFFHAPNIHLASTE